MTHLTFEEISELADNPLAESRATIHLADCSACRATLERVRALTAAAHALPREIAPPDDVWNDVRARVADDAARARRGAPGISARWWHNGWLATAAAILLVVGTASLMTLMSRGRTTKAKAMMVQNTPSTAALLAVDRNYVGTIRELRAALASERTRLAPSTVKTLETSLAVIDAAIAEARTALAADPANQALVDLLASHYERQVDLLQRATELSPSL